MVFSLIGILINPGSHQVDLSSAHHGKRHLHLNTAWENSLGNMYFLLI